MIKEPNEFQREGEHKKSLDTWYINVGESPMVARAMEHVFKTLLKPGYLDEMKQEELSSSEMLKKLEHVLDKDPGNLPELLVFLGGKYPSSQDIEDAIRAITLIRDDERIEHQPAAIYVGGVSGNEPDIPGADIILPTTDQIVPLLNQVFSVPDFLDRVATMYGDKMASYKGAFYDEYKEKLQSRSEITADTKQELHILKTIFDFYKVESVLDAGAGEGRIAIPLHEAGYKTIGIDISSELAKKTIENGFPFVVGDLKKLPFANESFDAVTYNWHVLCDILGVQGKRDLLGEAYRVLNKEGVVVLDIPDREKLDIKVDGIYFDDPGGEHLYIGYVPSGGQVQSLLEEQGFEHVQVKEWETEQGYPKLTFIGEKH